MFNDKFPDDVPEQEARPGTYQTVVRPHQLKRTDIYTEVLGKSRRNVVIEKVTCGEITYRGRPVPVLFVHGFDEQLKHPVRYTRTGWEFLEVIRIGEAPQYRRALEQLNVSTQFVY
jgi:hypothetical protein